MARILMLSFLLATGLPQSKEAAQGRTDQQRGGPAAAERRPVAAAVAAPAVWNWMIPVQTAQEDLRNLVRVKLSGQAPEALLGGAVFLLMAGLLVGGRRHA
jgi:hypothetical protein